MADDHNTGPLVYRPLLEQLHHHQARLAIERCCGLVGQDQPG